jgi:hypothetical protein
MLSWGVGVAFVLLVTALMVILAVRLHLARRHASGLQTAQLALEQQAAAFNDLLAAASNFSDSLLHLVYADVGMMKAEEGGPGPGGSAPLLPPPSEGEGSGEPGPYLSSSLEASPAAIFSVAERLTSSRDPLEASMRRQRERQWTQVNVASEAAAQVAPEPAGAGVFDAVSGEILYSLHGSAVPAVTRERSERDDLSGFAERSARAGATDEKSGRSKTTDPRALWEQETSYGAYGT